MIKRNDLMTPSKRNEKAWFSALLFIAGDYIALVLAGWLTLWIRNLLIAYNVYHIAPMYTYFWVPLVYMAFILYEGLYGKRMLIYQMTKKLFWSCVGGTVFSIILMFLARVAGEVSRFYVMLYPWLAFGFLCLIRVVLNRIMKRSEAFQVPVLIVGAGKTGECLAKQIQKDTGMRYRIVGFLEDNEPYDASCHILGGFDDLEKVIQETGVQCVFIAAPGISQEQLSTLIYQAQSLVRQVGVVPNLVAVPMSNVTVESFFDAKLMILQIQNNLAKKSNQLTKRLFDIIATIVGGLLISPFLLLIAAWVYHDSPGPVIFKHRRVGKDGKEFNCYKFRSMCVNSQEVLDHLLATDPAAKEEWDREFKLKNDPRITKSGVFLRKTSLDELPQLLNVLKGEMSLVGPRPIVQKEIPRYGVYFKEYAMVRPGITGIWQTSGRNDIDYPERVQMDNWYVHNWSVWLDLVLLWRTASVVAGCEGAY